MVRNRHRNRITTPNLSYEMRYTTGKHDMSNDKLAEALEMARNGLRWYQGRCPNEVNGCDDEAMATIDAALQAHAAEAAQERPCTCHPDDNPPVPCPQKFAYSECAEAARAQAQSSEWVMVPREPTKAMIEASCKIKLGRLEALRDGHGASSGVASAVREEWDAMLATAPQQAAEPVRQFRVVPKGSVWTDVKDPEIWASVTAHPKSYETRVLYTHPQPAQDAKLPSDEDFRLHLGELTSAELRVAQAAFRYAMAKESGR